MTSPITSLARSYVRSRATAVMGATCRIERIEKPSSDETSLIASPGSRETIYSGVCRIWSVTGAGLLELGEVDVSLQTTQLSIPWDVADVPRKYDEVQILTSPQDVVLIGRRFMITDVAKAGELRATRTFTVTTIAFDDR